MTELRLAEVLIRVKTELRALGVSWALIGGLAVSAWAEPRTTRDIDIAVAMEDDGEAEAFCRTMMDRGYRVDTHLEHGDAARLSTVRFVPPGDRQGILVDCLFASSGIEREIAQQAEVREVFPGLIVPMARIGHLLALKVLALRPDRPQERPQDFADIRELLKVADQAELRVARRALELISRRGFDRGKDLQAELEEQLRQFEEQQRESRS